MQEPVPTFIIGFLELRNPFSLFLHASIDLYQKPIYMREKLLYATNIITCSDFNREFIQRQFSDLDESIHEKVHVHHHGLDFDTMSFSANGRASNKVIAVGRFAKQKGFDYLLRAIRELKDRRVNVELDLVGDGEEATSLRSLVLALNIKDRVKFLGWLPADTVPATIRQASILVHPSPDLGDGVPNVIKEAMALGTPVVGSSVAGIPELLANGKHGMVVPPKDVNALANAIETLLVNENLRRHFAERARRYAEERFDLWSNGRHFAEVLSASKKL